MIEIEGTYMRYDQLPRATPFDGAIMYVIKTTGIMGINLRTKGYWLSKDDEWVKLEIPFETPVFRTTPFISQKPAAPEKRAEKGFWSKIKKFFRR